MIAAEQIVSDLEAALRAAAGPLAAAGITAEDLGAFLTLMRPTWLAQLRAVPGLAEGDADESADGVKVAPWTPEAGWTTPGRFLTTTLSLHGPWQGERFVQMPGGETWVEIGQAGGKSYLLDGRSRRTSHGEFRTVIEADTATLTAAQTAAPADAAQAAAQAAALGQLQAAGFKVVDVGEQAACSPCARRGAAAPTPDEVTTPHTRITWQTVGEWVHGWREIRGRKISSERHMQEQAHVAALADHPEIIARETDVTALSDAIVVCYLRKHGSFEARGDKSPEARLHVALANRLQALGAENLKPRSFSWEGTSADADEEMADQGADPAPGAAPALATPAPRSSPARRYARGAMVTVHGGGRGFRPVAAEVLGATWRETGWQYHVMLGDGTVVSRWEEDVLPRVAQATAPAAVPPPPAPPLMPAPPPVPAPVRVQAAISKGRQAVQAVGVFDLDDKGHRDLGARVARLLADVAEKYRAAGLPLEGKGRIKVVVAGRGNKSKYVAPPVDTLSIALSHAGNESFAEVAVVHELAHWYHYHHVGYDDARVMDQFKLVRKEKPTGGSAADRAEDEAKALLVQIKQATPGSPERLALGRRYNSLLTLANDQAKTAAGRYTDLRSPWIPTEYARKNHYEWFAELVTTRVLHPSSLSEPVKAWLAQVAAPNQETGGTAKGDLFSVDPARCDDRFCALLTHPLYADPRRAPVGAVRLVIRAPQDKPSARFSVRSADLLLIEWPEEKDEGGQDLVAALRAFLPTIAVPRSEPGLDLSQGTLWQLHRPVTQLGLSAFSWSLSWIGEQAAWLHYTRTGDASSAASSKMRLTQYAHVRDLAALPPGAPLAYTVTERTLGDSLQGRPGTDGTMRVTYERWDNSHVLVTDGKKRYRARPERLEIVAS